MLCMCRWANAQPTGIGTLCTKRPSAFWLKAPSLLKISTSWAKIQTCHKYTLFKSHILPFERNPAKKLVSICRQLLRVSTTVSGLSTVSIIFGRAVKETDKVEMFDWTHVLPIFILMIYNGTYEFGSFYNLEYPVFSGLGLGLLFHTICMLLLECVDWLYSSHKPVNML